MTEEVAQPQSEAGRDGLLRSAICHLAGQTAGENLEKSAELLAETGEYIASLLHSDLLSDEEAKTLAAAMRDRDPRFFVRFQIAAGMENQTPETRVMGRALRLFEELGRPNVLLPWLRAVTNHPDERIQSKAVKALCEMRPNVALVERQLKSEDARVRANAIEALWSLQSAEAMVLFREALGDSSHRVVVNALVGLYRLKARDAFTRLIALTEDESALVRSAAAWGLGEIGDARGVTALEKLSNDRSKPVRTRARLSLEKFTPLAAAS